MGPIAMPSSLPRSLKQIRIRYFGKSANLTPLSECGSATIRAVESASLATWRGPRFAGKATGAPSVPSVVHVERPPLQIAEFRNATPLPASDIVVLKEQSLAVHPDYFVPSRDVCHYERLGRMIVSPSCERIYYRHTKPKVNLVEAISLLGQSSGNYAHFITETLPKLLLVDSLPEYRKIPILVDGWIHDNHRVLIKLFNKTRRQVIPVAPSQPAHVERLISISPVAYAPPEYRSFLSGGEPEFTPYDVYKFSETALNMVRKRRLKVGRSKYGRRLFLYRRTANFGNGRNAVNIAKLCRIARRAGFDVVEPGSLSVADQIATFRNAEIVVSPIGAAMANLMFTPRGCKVICLSAVYDSASYYYFSNMMAALGHDLTYVIGPQASKSGHLFHRDYEVDIDDFYAALSGAINSA